MPAGKSIRLRRSLSLTPPLPLPLPLHLRHTDLVALQERQGPRRMVEERGGLAGRVPVGTGNTGDAPADIRAMEEGG